MKTLKNLLVITALFSANVAQADGEYTRFWRGFKRADISETTLVDDLNRKLFPATGELAHTDAKLLAYVPATILQTRNETVLPDEVAVLSYETEKSYRDYRATPVGKRYGELHGEMFDMQKSKSLVVEPFLGTVASEHAYTNGSLYQAVKHEDAKFDVMYRPLHMNVGSWLLTIEEWLQSVKLEQAWTILVADDYAMIYTFGRGAAQELPFRSTHSRELSVQDRITSMGEGIIFPVGQSTEEATVRATWERHIDAWKRNSVVDIVADYNDQSIVIINDSIYRGRDEIGRAFATLFATFAKVAASAIDRIVIERSSVYLLWQSTLPSGQKVLGTDTFLIRNGVIEIQTITTDPVLWNLLRIQ
jgi:hypothetical protein